MLFITIALFVLGQVLAKLVFLNQVAAYKQFKGVVHCGPANVEIFFPDVGIKGLSFKMVGTVVYFLQDNKPFGSFA